MTGIIDFPILGTDAVATLGIQGLYLNNAGGKGGFPVFNFSDGTGFSGIGAPSDRNFQSRSWQFNDNLSWIHGRHTLKFGGTSERLGTKISRPPVLMVFLGHSTTVKILLVGILLPIFCWACPHLTSTESLDRTSMNSPITPISTLRTNGLSTAASP